MCKKLLTLVIPDKDTTDIFHRCVFMYFKRQSKAEIVFFQPSSFPRQCQQNRELTLTEHPSALHRVLLSIALPLHLLSLLFSLLQCFTVIVPLSPFYRNRGKQGLRLFWSLKVPLCHNLPVIITLFYSHYTVHTLLS